MARSFDELEAALSPEARRRADLKYRELKTEMALQELRNAMNISQEYIADILGVRQSAVSRLERRADMYVSTLRSFIRALGGELEIIARFPEGDVSITQFQEMRNKEEESTEEDGIVPTNPLGTFVAQNEDEEVFNQNAYDNELIDDRFEQVGRFQEILMNTFSHSTLFSLPTVGANYSILPDIYSPGKRSHLLDMFTESTFLSKDIIGDPKKSKV